MEKEDGPSKHPIQYGEDAKQRRILQSLSSSPRAKRAGPKGLRAESARAVTGRRCPHSGVG